MRRSIILYWVALGLLLVANPAGIFASETAGHPDDIYWDNSISPLIAGVNGSVGAMTVYNGKLVVGGSFTIAGGVVANNIACWDGTSWSSLGSGVDDAVLALTVHDGKLIAGGWFRTASGVRVNSVACWDGSSWSPLGSGMNGPVLALTVYDGKLIAGGGFSEAIAYWGGDSWYSLGSGLSDGQYWDPYVHALAVYGEKLVAAGLFYKAGSVSVNCIAAWDGNNWSALGAGITLSSYYHPWIYSLAEYDGKLIAGGWFDTAGSISAKCIATWDGTQWSSMGTEIGTWDIVYSMTVFDGQLIVGLTARVALWDGNNWSRSKSLVAGDVRSLAVYGNRLIAGASGGVAAWDGSNWLPLGSGTTGDNPYFTSVNALTVYDGKLIAGGSCTSLNGVAALAIASWDGSNWSPLGSGIDGTVHALTVYDDNLIAGGNFTKAGGTSASSIASWDGSTWSPLGSGMGQYGDVQALTVYDGKLIAGGVFQTAGGNTANNISSWDGNTWSPLEGGMKRASVFQDDYPFVSALIPFDGKLIAGGYFDTAGGVAANNIASWDGASWSSLGGGMGAYYFPFVSALTVYDNNLIAGGNFTTAGGTRASSIASWDGSTWSPLGSGVDGWVHALTVYNGHLIAGGGFGVAGGVVANDIASWDGSTWSTLGSGMNGWVHALTVFNSNLVAGGSFTTAGDKVSAYLAAWTKRTPMIFNPEIQETYVDVRPGLCPNPLYGRDLCSGKSVIPVAVLGSAEFDVNAIDPFSVTLCGVRALEWSLLDVSTPVDKTTDSCACSTNDPDGYPDLLLKFEQCAIESAIKPPPPPPGTGTGVEVAKLAIGTGDLTALSTNLSEEPAKPPLVLTLHGMLEDGSPIIGYDCLELSDKVTPAIEPIEEPQQAGLRGNYPNPFNPTTTISYSVPAQTHVVIELFNIVGQRIRTLVDETKPSGVYEVVWNGTDNSGQPLSSGVYLYRLKAGDFIETRKMVLLK